MTHPRILACLLFGTLLLAACSKDKPSGANSADNSASSPAPAASDNASPSTNPAPAPPVAEAPPPPPPPPPPPKPVVIPAGTVLTVRLGNTVGSKTSHTGDRFQASLAEPIVVGNKAVAPAGSSVAGTVTEAHPAGRFKGAATLNLAADTLTIRGVTYRIQASPVSQESKGKGKRTAGMVGGGAAGGAVIGALAGGGKGAAIGALVGAGAGTAGAAFTGNRDISLPAESALSFQLTAPVTLKAAKSQSASSDSQ
jgi:hypothetical protein